VPVDIRTARPDEADALTELAHRAKRHWGYPVEWIAAWQSALTLTPVYVTHHPVALAVAVDGPRGFYALEAPEGPTGLWSLAHLWVEPAWHGRGLGRQLFRHAAHAVRQWGGAGLHIEADPNAAGFYERVGARPTGSVAAPMHGDPSRALPVLVYTCPAG
jgi:predicted N-acetyltransferase YhbS